jgi:hypothetical protein
LYLLYVIIFFRFNVRVIIVQELKPQAFTVLGWNVNNIYSTIQLLNSNNIFCENYEFLEQDNLGIWTSPNGSKAAWFKDPDGNVLSLTA